MPFSSKKQRAFMYAKHPEIAKRWDKETKSELPEYAPMDKKGRYQSEIIKKKAK